MAAFTRQGTACQALFLLCAIVLSFVTVSDASLRKIEAPCTACKAVARTLQARINNEKERQPVDLRHRLDKEGKRYGKVIEYKKSELRVVELLDNVCSGIKGDWSLVSITSTDGTKRTRHWAKHKGKNPDDMTNTTRPSHNEEEMLGKRLESYCGSLLEEYEEDIYEAVTGGAFDTDGVEVHLCRSIITPCPKRNTPLSAEGALAADADADGTLEILPPPPPSPPPPAAAAEPPAEEAAAAAEPSQAKAEL